MKILLAAPLATGLFALSCAGPSAAPPAGSEPPIPVRVARAESSQIPLQFDAGGVVRGRLTAVISSRLMAPVTDVRVRAGDAVRAGQILVTLDGRDVQAQADRATAALAAAREGVRAAESDKAAADAGLTLATAGFDRVKGLHAKRSATDHELDEATAAFQTARARVASAQAHAAEAAASLTAADEGARAATIAASYATLIAPFAGRIAERVVDPGAMATPGAPLLTLEDTSLVRLEVSLDESRARAVTVGGRAEVALDGQSDGDWHAGRIAEVGRLDPASHSFLAKIDLPSATPVQPGAYGRARFSSGTRATTTVPANAVVRRGQMTFVFVVAEDGRAHLRPVTLGASSGNRVETLAGVSERESVVESPPLSLADGALVKSGDQR